ncbi:hypothetical protein MPDQ_006642 [Monascus purpureus]|uniref:Uncharacterized protein n=1 Tax=Monascus purpureus TaxID=5098 RepID=A0A507R4M8_MONPU|nr:hypothetical protein MPDQ_006642 [Monascus purpureus]BDD60635.1 hypothetical protein MAP00_005742 [Monascus purpureus]
MRLAYLSATIWLVSVCLAGPITPGSLKVVQHGENELEQPAVALKERFIETVDELEQPTPTLENRFIEAVGEPEEEEEPAFLEKREPIIPTFFTVPTELPPLQTLPCSLPPLPTSLSVADPLLFPLTVTFDNGITTLTETFTTLPWPTWFHGWKRGPMPTAGIDKRAAVLPSCTISVDLMSTVIVTTLAPTASANPPPSTVEESTTAVPPAKVPASSSSSSCPLATTITEHDTITSVATVTVTSYEYFSMSASLFTDTISPKVPVSTGA